MAEEKIDLGEVYDTWIAPIEGPREPPVCNNCRQRWRHHVEKKCPFEASNYDEGPEPYLWSLDEFKFTQEDGIAVGNLAAVRKIKLEEEDREERKYVRNSD